MKTDVVWIIEFDSNLNINTIYCDIIFAHHIESTKFIEFFFKTINCENILTTGEARFLPDSTAWLHTPAKRRLRQTQPQAAP
jgi:hypothetical protein